MAHTTLAHTSSVQKSRQDSYSSSSWMSQTCWTRPSGLQLVADLPHKFMPLCPVLRVLDAFGRTPVHHAYHSAALRRLRDDHFYRICRRAVNRAHFKTVADAAEYIDRIGLADQDHECVARANRLRIRDGSAAKVFVVGLHANHRRLCRRLRSKARLRLLQRGQWAAHHRSIFGLPERCATVRTGRCRRIGCSPTDCGRRFRGGRLGRSL